MYIGDMYTYHLVYMIRSMMYRIHHLLGERLEAAMAGSSAK